uniref:Zinc finger SWIM-type containing 9 n=1 Tax=Equus caballus TaxID=9796 RepID=A0A9L0T707_HORSE
MEPPPGTAAGQEEQELRERAFFSWAEFSRFFDAWCQQRLALFFVKSSMHLARCRWASAPPLYTLIDVLKYSYVRLVCKDVRAPSRPAVGCVSPAAALLGAGEWGGRGARGRGKQRALIQKLGGRDAD